MEVDPAKYVTLMDHPKLYMRSGPKNYFLSLLRRHTQKSLLLLSKSEMLSSLHSWVSANASTNPISKSVVVRTRLTVLWWGCRTKSTRNRGPPWFRGRWDLNRIWRFVTRGGDNLAVGSRTCPTRGSRYSSVVTGTMGGVAAVRRGEVTDRDNWQSGSS
jgi:hypothetical protein